MVAADLDDFPVMDETKPRRTLGPSKKQRDKETVPEEEEKLLEDETKAEEEEDGPKVVLQTGLLAKLNLPPTDILSQYQNNGSPVSKEKAPADGDEKEEDDVHRTDLESELEAWDAVEQLRGQQSDAPPQKGVKVTDEADTIITYEQALHFLRRDMSKKTDIKIHDYRNVGWFKSMRVTCFGKPSLSEDLKRERDEFFCIAATKCDYDLSEHERILQTIYRQLTGDHLTCPRHGSHWQIIGFQGKDPATDLRGTGMLGPLQLLYMVKNYRSHALKTLQLSRDEEQNFPFAVVAGNISSMVMQAMREGSLHAKIKSKKSVWLVVNELFCAIFYKFYLTWSQRAYTIRNFQEMKEYLAIETCKRPKQLLHFFKINKHAKKIEEAEDEFTEIP